MVLIMATQRTTARKRPRSITNIIQYAFTVIGYDGRIKINQARQFTAMRIMAGGTGGIGDMRRMQRKGFVSQDTVSIMASITQCIVGRAFRGTVTIHILPNQQR